MGERYTSILGEMLEGRMARCTMITHTSGLQLHDLTTQLFSHLYLGRRITTNHPTVAFIT